MNKYKYIVLSKNKNTGSKRNAELHICGPYVWWLELMNLQHKLGEWSFNSKNRETFYEAHMFPLLVKDQLEFWPEKDIRQRKWVIKFLIPFVFLIHSTMFD